MIRIKTCSDVDRVFRTLRRLFCCNLV